MTLAVVFANTIFCICRIPNMLFVDYRDVSERTKLCTT